ncbi:SpoIIE family protein phosphatase [Teredinibacter haidensis]|uniref:SpoIIE family protein phosphatase n=1 Tax=Teredinibacter haidensis TaxID=2731755 RepID=UPI00094911D7|nr:fused response regulator/phosphatase [Teredinibacter haidensis]
MKILIVDDHAYNRDLLTFILNDEGHECVEVENGKEACEIYRKDQSIELILMDINMPVMDGVEATKIIKAESGDRFVPVIFVTALDDSDVIASCLGAGGDDFVPKPVNENVLLAKIYAHDRVRGLYSRLQQANKSLLYHQRLMKREHTIVEHIFARGNQRSKTRCDNIVTYTSPASMFDGDMVLSAASPSGGVYLIVGDFTGHGLAAAIGSLPVTEVFNNLVAKQVSVSKIAVQLNERLFELLPTNMFCCATIMHLDSTGVEVTFWSGGMNDLLVFRRGSGELEKIEATHMPLGILSVADFDDGFQKLKIKGGDKIYVYTDGVNEAVNVSGEAFGLGRLEEIILAGGDRVVENVTRAVSQFNEGGEQSDDMSMAEITGGKVVHRSQKTGEVIDVGARYLNADSLPWSFSLRIEGKDLGDASIVSQIIAFVSGVRGIEPHLDRISTIISELYSNSLERGVLRLGAALKNSDEDIEAYSREREQRLQSLDGEFIDIEIRYLRETLNKLQLKITDSGDGFDCEKANREGETGGNRLSQGIPLLRSLCSSLTYTNKGRTAIAVYDLDCSCNP